MGALGDRQRNGLSDRVSSGAGNREYIHELGRSSMNPTGQGNESPRRLAAQRFFQTIYRRLLGTLPDGTIRPPSTSYWYPIQSASLYCTYYLSFVVSQKRFRAECYLGTGNDRRNRDAGKMLFRLTGGHVGTLELHLEELPHDVRLAVYFPTTVEADDDADLLATLEHWAIEAAATLRSTMEPLVARVLRGGADDGDSSAMIPAERSAIR